MHAGKDAAYWYGCSVVCLSATTASTTKTAEPIEVPFGPREPRIKWGFGSSHGMGHFLWGGSYFCTPRLDSS